ncbi:MAG: Crp/Fnr family transcriptional regulator [Paracoccaceae bacterium]
MRDTATADAIRTARLARTDPTRFLNRMGAARLETVPADRALQIAGDASASILVVRQGWLMISKSTRDGQRQIVDFALPGDIVDPGSASAGVAATDVSSLTPVRLAILPHKDWRQLRQAHPELQQAHDRRLAACHARLAERMLRLGKGSAECRIAYAICELSLRSGEAPLGDGRAVNLPLTQQVLGDFVGLSSVHVSRTLRRMRQRRILGRGDRLELVIRDMAALARLAEIDPDALRREIVPTV